MEDRESIELRGTFKDDRGVEWTWEITFERAETYEGWGYYGEVWSNHERHDIPRGAIEGKRNPAELENEGELISRNRLP